MSFILILNGDKRDEANRQRCFHTRDLKGNRTMAIHPTLNAVDPATGMTK